MAMRRSSPLAPTHARPLVGIASRAMTHAMTSAPKTADRKGRVVITPARRTRATSPFKPRATTNRVRSTRTATARALGTPVRSAFARTRRSIRRRTLSTGPTSKYWADIEKLLAGYPGLACSCVFTFGAPCCRGGKCLLGDPCVVTLPKDAATETSTNAAADATEEDATVDACTSSVCTASCVPGAHNVSRIVDGCEVWQCCVPDDAGSSADVTAE